MGYKGCYKLVMENGLLAPGGIMLCDNVLYRGLTAQHNAGEMPQVSEKTAANAASMGGFLGLVRADTAAKKVRTLMMPVRDGMLALQMPQAASVTPPISNKGYPARLELLGGCPGELEQRFSIFLFSDVS